MLTKKFEKLKRRSKIGNAVTNRSDNADLKLRAITVRSKNGSYMLRAITNRRDNPDLKAYSDNCKKQKWLLYAQSDN